MNKPKWQRARVIFDDDDPELVGRELWTRGQPEMRKPGVIPGTNKPNRCGGPSFITNIKYGRLTVIYQFDSLELLARGPEDFLFDDPPMLTWEEFLAGGQS